MPRPIILSCIFFIAALPAMADPVGDILQSARSDCESYESGVFEAGDAISEADLDGDGSMDRLVDESRFSCSSAPGMYCGTGGCRLHAVIGAKSWSFQAEDWRMIDWDNWPILLISRDGGFCGATGAQSCFEAVVWSAGDMLTVMPPIQ